MHQKPVTEHNKALLVRLEEGQLHLAPRPTLETAEVPEVEAAETTLTLVDQADLEHRDQQDQELGQEEMRLVDLQVDRELLNMLTIQTLER